MGDPKARGGAPPATGADPDLGRAIEARGPTDAPVLILLHGTRRTRRMWRHQLDDLSDTFRVLAVDLPGHGALADLPFRLAGASAMVRSIIDSAGGRAIVIGQSLGAYVGMDLAAGSPDRVAGLVVASGSAEPRSVVRRAPRTVGQYLLAAASDRVRGRGGLSTGMAAAVGDEGSDPITFTGGSGADDLPATNGWLFKGGVRTIVNALGEAFIPRLALYPGPTLLVNGEDDHLMRHGEDAFLAAAVNGRLDLIRGCGHLVNEDQPAAFNAAIRRFAAEVAALRSGPEPA